VHLDFYRQHCNDIETILFGNLQRSNILAMFWQYSMQWYVDCSANRCFASPFVARAVSLMYLTYAGVPKFSDGRPSRCINRRRRAQLTSIGRDLLADDATDRVDALQSVGVCRNSEFCSDAVISHHLGSSIDEDRENHRGIAEKDYENGRFSLTRDLLSKSGSVYYSLIYRAILITVIIGEYSLSLTRGLQWAIAVVDEAVRVKNWSITVNYSSYIWL